MSTSTTRPGLRLSCRCSPNRHVAARAPARHRKVRSAALTARAGALRSHASFPMPWPWPVRVQHTSVFLGRNEVDALTRHSVGAQPLAFFGGQEQECDQVGHVDQRNASFLPAGYDVNPLLGDGPEHSSTPRSPGPKTIGGRTMVISISPACLAAASSPASLLRP